MKETDLQKRIVDAVRANGGAAHKLSNRFLIGVADLLVSIPGAGSALLEVKLNKMPVKKDTVDLEVTRLQEEFLRDYAQSGMAAGVAAFLQDGRKLYLGVWPITIFNKMQGKTSFTVYASAFNGLRAGEKRNGDIYEDVFKFVSYANHKGVR